MNRFSECSCKSIAMMAFYFQHKDDENKNCFNSGACEYGLKLLTEIIGNDKDIENYRTELMEEAGFRYSSLYGLYDVSLFNEDKNIKHAQ